MYEGAIPRPARNPNMRLNAFSKDEGSSYIRSADIRVFYSPAASYFAHQQKLGLQAMGEVYKQMPVLPDSSPITKYVQHLGKKLVKQIPQENSWPYQFHVVQQKEINAFAL